MVMNMLVAGVVRVDTTTNRGSNRSQSQRTMKSNHEEQTIAKTGSNEVRPTCLRPRGNQREICIREDDYNGFLASLITREP